MKKILLLFMIVLCASCKDDEVVTRVWFMGERNDTIKIERLIERDSCEVLFEGKYIADLQLYPKIVANDEYLTFKLSIWKDSVWIPQSHKSLYFLDNTPKNWGFLSFTNNKGLIKIQKYEDN